jgi:hypothetical protein
MIARASVVGLVAVLACGDHRREPAHELPHDAARAVPATRVPSGQMTDLGDGHLDEDVPHHGGGTLVAPRPPRPIDVTLQSTPPGAQVLVDGVLVGTTPTFWNGEADGREHEFVFMRRDHTTARYRFVPVTSGVIHARLERVSEEPDAGVDDDNAPLPGAPLPGAGSMLVNPPPAPEVVPKVDAPAVESHPAAVPHDEHGEGPRF